MKNQDILVSVIITCYNKEKYIEKAIKSVLDQKTTFKFEIIIVDDCSTDESWKIIRKLQSENTISITAYRNSNNLGITKTWINICKKATGKYIARLDGDDFWTDTLKLTKQVSALKKSKDSRWCSTEFDILNEDGQILKNAVLNKLVPFTDNFEAMLIKKGFTNSSTWLIEASLIKDINKNLNINTADDTFDIQLELFRNTKLTYIKESMAVYRNLLNSDSRLSESRINNLLKTQLKYINISNKIDKEYMLKLSLEEYAKLQIANLEIEKLIVEQAAIIQHGHQQINDMKNSKTWKIGTLITKPLHKIFKK